VLGTGWYREARDRNKEQASIETRLSRLEQAPPAADDASRHGSEPAYSPRPSPMGTAGANRSGPGAPRVPSAEELRRARRQAVAKLEARFSGDGFDPRWAGPTEAAAARAAQDPVLAPFRAPAASEVDCARTMCRLVFTFDNLDQAEDWSSFYPLGLAKTLPGFRTLSTVLPDGRVELRMYGFRDPRASTAD